MLVIPSSTAEYFNQVQKWAENHNISEFFHLSMLSVHLYGGGWVDPEMHKIYLFQDQDFNSFTFSAETRQEGGSYEKLFDGGLIYHGPRDSNEILELLRSIPHHELMAKLRWRMHT